MGNWRRTRDEGWGTMDGGRWTVDDGRWTMDDGRWTENGGELCLGCEVGPGLGVMHICPTIYCKIGTNWVLTRTNVLYYNAAKFVFLWW